MAVGIEEPKAVVLRGDDNVAVAARPIPRGFVLSVGGRTVAVREPIGRDTRLPWLTSPWACPSAIRVDHRLRSATPPDRTFMS